MYMLFLPCNRVHRLQKTRRDPHEQTAPRFLPIKSTITSRQLATAQYNDRQYKRCEDSRDDFGLGKQEDNYFLSWKIESWIIDERMYMYNLHAYHA